MAYGVNPTGANLRAQNLTSSQQAAARKAQMDMANMQNALGLKQLGQQESQFQQEYELNKAIAEQAAEAARWKKITDAVGAATGGFGGLAGNLLGTGLEPGGWMR